MLIYNNIYNKKRKDRQNQQNNINKYSIKFQNIEIFSLSLPFYVKIS